METVRTIFTVSVFTALCMVTGCYFDAVGPFETPDYSQYQNVTARVLTVNGDPVSDTIPNPEFYAWYQFDAMKDSTYNFIVSSTGSANLFILPQTKDTVLSGFSFSSSTSVRYSWVSRQTGRYFILLSAVHADSTDYTLSLRSGGPK
jgi:hypothetical protein